LILDKLQHEAFCKESPNAEDDTDATVLMPSFVAPADFGEGGLEKLMGEGDNNLYHKKYIA